jgi:hypothetical protein
MSKNSEDTETGRLFFLAASKDMIGENEEPRKDC